MNDKTTISDIAKEADVSKTTISRYLNGHYNFMSAETRKNIEQIIARRGYIPNSVARTLKSKKSNLIGIVVNTLRYQVAAQTVTGIHDTCVQNGYGTMVYCSNDDPETERAAIQLCLNQQVDGLIIIPCENSAARYQELCQQGIPVVLCTRRLADWPYGCVYVRHDELIRAMLEHLRTQGFEKVCFFLDVENFHKKWMADVFASCGETLFGMARADSIALVGRETPCISHALDTFLERFPTQKKAVLAVNTHTLFLTLKELEHRKLRIPEDLGVCGYDAIGWSELVYPGITAIQQPMLQMGIDAGVEMMECLRENRLSRGDHPLTGTIFYRESTKKF